jgi:fluoride ion exporter CrcB/FEX
MEYTDFWGFPYPGLHEAPNGPAQMEAMAKAVDAALSNLPLCVLTTNQTLGQTIGDNTTPVLTFDVVRRNPSGMYVAATSTNKIFCVRPGDYDFFAASTFMPNPNGSRFINFLVNGTEVRAREERGANQATGRGTTVSTFDTLSLDTGDFVQVQVWQNSGGNLLTSAAAATLSRFSARFVHA